MWFLLIFYSNLWFNYFRQFSYLHQNVYSGLPATWDLYVCVFYFCLFCHCKCFCIKHFPCSNACIVYSTWNSRCINFCTGLTSGSSITCSISLVNKLLGYHVSLSSSPNSIYISTINVFNLDCFFSSFHIWQMISTNTCFPII